MPSAKGKGKGKGKDVDWKATAEMLSVSRSTDTEQETETDYFTTTGTAPSMTADAAEWPDRDASPTQRQTRKGFDTIKLIYDLGDKSVVKANYMPLPTARGAPPPPPPPPVHRAMAPKPEADRGLSDGISNGTGLADGSGDTEMAGFNERGDLAGVWHGTIQHPLGDRMKNAADSATAAAAAAAVSSKVLTSMPDPELAPQVEVEYIALTRWECHECNLFHPIAIDDSGWDGHDPNVCKCCNHDRCGHCWDLDAAGWRLQFCDGGSFGS